MIRTEGDTARAREVLAEYEHAVGAGDRKGIESAAAALSFWLEQALKTIETAAVTQ